jgi:hypothetical protein
MGAWGTFLSQIERPPLEWENSETGSPANAAVLAQVLGMELAVCGRFLIVLYTSTFRGFILNIGLDLFIP